MEKNSVMNMFFKHSTDMFVNKMEGILTAETYNKRIKRRHRKLLYLHNRELKRALICLGIFYDKNLPNMDERQLLVYLLTNLDVATSSRLRIFRNSKRLDLRARCYDYLIKLLIVTTFIKEIKTDTVTENRVENKSLQTKLITEVVHSESFVTLVSKMDNWLTEEVECKNKYEHFRLGATKRVVNLLDLRNIGLMA